jgi:threonine synthase
VGVIQLTCFACGKAYEPEQCVGLCTCGKPLRVDLDLGSLGREELNLSSMAGMTAVLPVTDPSSYRTLGEGGTPLLDCRSLVAETGHRGPLWIKDEGVNPTGSFKARGMAMAVHKAAQFGVRKLAVPSAGNAGGALAAYTALYGLEAHVFMPLDVPMANRLECELYGARVTLVEGLITDCAKLVMEGREREGWFDVSTLKEPYRIEGKKTMGYELAAQLGWVYPDVVIYPTGGGTGAARMDGWEAAPDDFGPGGRVRADRPAMAGAHIAR